MVSSNIFTKKELEVIGKKIKSKRLSQTDSNYLYKFIKPKLKEIVSLDANKLLNKMEYNQKINSIETKIKKAILESLPKTDAIIIYGSAIQNHYKDYNDIDILIATKAKIYDKISSKCKKIKEIEKELQKENINADIQIYTRKDVEYGLRHSPTLIYELSDCKVIYGKLNIPNRNRTIYRIDLRMKLSSSDIEDTYLTGNDIYKALRNIITVRMILNKIIDNQKLKDTLNEEIGTSLIKKLKNNCESKIDRRIALLYLRELLEKTREEIKGDLWEKIEL